MEASRKQVGSGVDTPPVGSGRWVNGDEQKQREEGENEECTQTMWRASVLNGKAQPRRSALVGIERGKQSTRSRASHPPMTRATQE